MKLFSKEQIYKGHAYSAESQKISSTELMERAGIQIFNWLHIRMQGAQVPIHVFCGIGDNGGNGLVVARQLITHGYNVKTYIVNHSKTRSKDFLENYDRIKNTSKDWPTLLDNNSTFPEMHPNDIIVDAIFGTGLNRAVDGWIVNLFNHFRAQKAFTLSIDIPSGLSTDKAPTNPEAVVNAGYTLSFQSPKLVFFLPETAKYTVQWEALDIGIDAQYLLETEANVELIGKNEMLPLYKPREKFSNKGNFGHAYIIGGSFGKMGAVTLASKAALISGAGKVSAYIPKCGYAILQTSFPEAMVECDNNETILTNIALETLPTAIGLGVGLGLKDETVKAVKTFLKENKLPLVIDADAISILGKDKDLLGLLPESTVFTPHPKELEYLIGKWSDDFDKIAKTKAFCEAYKAIVVIKGFNTITVYNNKLFINTTGNPGLATAGTGDVLTGLITGLIAQSYNPLEAALFGTYLHGKSGDIMVEDTGYQSLIASHVIEGIPLAYLDMFKQSDKPEVEEVENEDED